MNGFSDVFFVVWVVFAVSGRGDCELGIDGQDFWQQLIDQAIFAFIVRRVVDSLPFEELVSLFDLEYSCSNIRVLLRALRILQSLVSFLFYFYFPVGLSHPLLRLLILLPFCSLQSEAKSMWETQYSPP